MSTRMGANPDQLEDLGRKVKAQQEAVNSIISTVSGALRSTDWEGPAKQRFESDWDTSFSQALRKMNEAFEAAGTECIQRAGALRNAMSYQ
jgi:uncharacterized protein YukE